VKEHDRPDHPQASAERLLAPETDRDSPDEVIAPGIR
jgi:hypothetical protein